jgi:hypothetical protein
MVIVNSEQCVVGTIHNVVTDTANIACDSTHAQSRENKPRNNKGACRVTCVLAELRAHYTTHANPQTREEEKRGERKKRTEKRVVLDGGGARLADAATRHHLTPTRTRREKRKHGEQNKHTRTQTIQKTSTRPSTSHGHHTLPGMRNQTPIHKQRTTQTQLS